MKNLIFFAIILSVSVAVYQKSTPVSVDKKLEVTILRNSEPITHLNQTRKVADTKKLYIDKVYFKNGQILSHYKLGQIGGYRNDFFMELRSIMDVIVPGKYTFLMQSDDGFKLIIDGRQICEFYTHRPISLNECTIELGKGKHALLIEYYQGFGNQGLIAEYKDPSGKRAYIGEDDSIRFTP